MGNLQEESDLENTVKISARRFEESPYISRIDDSKMIRGVYAGRYHAIFNGEDVLQKYWTLRKKALIYDVPEKGDGFAYGYGYAICLRISNACRPTSFQKLSWLQAALKHENEYAELLR